MIKAKYTGCSVGASSRVRTATVHLPHIGWRAIYLRLPVIVISAFMLLISRPALVRAEVDGTAMKFKVSAIGVVTASGQIRAGTVREFRSFLIANGRFGREWPTEIELNSPGGAVVAAMHLGRFIRLHRMAVNVVGPCASACTLAAAGGIRRRVSKGGFIGIHQFTFPEHLDGPAAAARAQRLAAEIDEYLEDMGIHRGFGREALRTSPQTIRTLSEDELRRFGFVSSVAFN